MSYVIVNNDEHSYIREEGDGEQWGRRDCYHTDHSIRSISVVDDNKYHDLVVEFDIHPLETYYIVYAIYSTGDSFGYDTGRIEYIGLFANKTVAYENVRRIQEHNDEHQNRRGYTYGTSKKKGKAEKKEKYEEFSVTLVSESGKKFKVHTPWHGYFESLESVECVEVLVE